MHENASIGPAGGSWTRNTNHQSIIDFEGKSYSICHNGAVPTGGDYRRSVCVDYLRYNADSTMQKVVMTNLGVDPAL